MARFFSIHQAPGLSEEDFAAGAEEIVTCRHATHEMSYIDLRGGKIVNIYEADDVASLESEFERLGWPWESIHSLEMAVSLDDLRKLASS